MSVNVIFLVLRCLFLMNSDTSQSMIPLVSVAFWNSCLDHHAYRHVLLPVEQYMRRASAYGRGIYNTN